MQLLPVVFYMAICVMVFWTDGTSGTTLMVPGGIHWCVGCFRPFLTRPQDFYKEATHHRPVYGLGGLFQSLGLDLQLIESVPRETSRNGI